MSVETELQRIKALASAASDGPWAVIPARPGGSHLGVASAGSAYPDVARAEEGYDGYGNGTRRPDAAFIADARTTVPRLVAALEAGLAEHKHDGSGDCMCCGGESGWPCPTVTAITAALTPEEDARRPAHG